MKIPYYLIIPIILATSSCNNQNNILEVEVYETASNGNKLKEIDPVASNAIDASIVLNPEEEFQNILGFGGSFTESSAYLLKNLSPQKQEEIIEAYFGNEGARYSLTRTHINSCDFSLGNYSYAPVEGDKSLEHFSIDEDRDDIIPMIRMAQAVSEDGFKILASPWTAPPWMKDNQSWKGGKLLPEYNDSWALFFSKYIEAYQEEGINIWGLTVENEPLGNNSNWESMHYTPEETVDFVKNHLGPRLENDGHDVKIFGYDQNRGRELDEWTRVLYKDEESSKYFDGTAVHWYASTNDWFGESLEAAHALTPDKYLLQTEGCIDSEVPHWQDDAWYWSKEATDWGWDWASEEDKKYHPKYVPVYRYARDIIGCMNSMVEGWIDWNMVLDRQGGPNWAKNWCVAPVLVDIDLDEVYYTPLYHTMVHFSKFIQPGAVRIGFQNSDEELMVTAARNLDNSLVVVLLNMSAESKIAKLDIDGRSVNIPLNKEAIQTIVTHL